MPTHSSSDHGRRHRDTHELHVFGQNGGGWGSQKMSGFQAELLLNDDQVQRAFRNLLERGQSLRPLFADLGEQLLTSTRERFRADSRESPDGAKWPPLSDSTRKKRNETKILIEGGDLLQTLAHQPTRAQLKIGSPRIYGAVHQFGWPERNIPARPYLGLSDDDRAAVHETVARYLRVGEGK